MTRRHGEGTVEKRGDRWRFRCVDGSGGRHTSKAEYASEKDAFRALALFRKKVADGELVAKKGMSLRAYFERRYLPRLERDVERGTRRPNTLKHARSHWPRLEGIADVKLERLDVPTISRWADRIAGEIERPTSYLALLRKILQDAVSKDWLLKENPARGVRIEEADADDDEKRPTPEEATRLLACEAIPLPDRLIMGFALGTGLRPGEWCSLELVDVHLDAEIPVVIVQYGSEDRGPTKSGEKRTVPVMGVALTSLRAWLAQLPLYAPKNPLGLVFPTKTGKRRDSHPFGRRRKGGRQEGLRVSRWADFLTAAGIARPLTPHSLRHGFATELLTGARGEQLPPWAVQVAMGHAKISTTEKYLHPGEQDLLDEVRKRSPNSPRRNTAAPESALFSGGSGGRSDVVPRGGIEPADLPRLAIVGATQGENVGAGTDAGLMLARVRAGEWPSLEEFRALVATSGHPVVSAVRRLDGPAWRAAGLELLEILAVDVAASRRGSGR